MSQSNGKQQLNSSGSLLSSLGGAGDSLSSTTGSRPGGLSALSTLTNLLDTASTFASTRPDDEFLGSGSKQSGRTRLDYSRGDEGKNTSRFPSGRWKSTAGFGDFGGGGISGGGRRHPISGGGGGSATADSLSKSFQTQHRGSPDVLVTRPSSDTASFVGPSALSTPGATSLHSASPMASSHGCGMPLSAVSPDAREGDVVTPPKASDTEQKSSEIKVARSSPGATQAWRPRRSADPKEAMRREVNSLLNKLTVENFPTVGERLCTIIESVTTEEQLTNVVSLVLDKAFNEPDFSELYADLCLVMSLRAPTLSSAEQVVSSKPPHQALFSSILFSKWREEFNKYVLENRPPRDEDQETMISKMKIRIKGLCGSFAEFVVRRMVGMRGFNAAVSAILSPEIPAEHMVEGVCQMLTTAGNFLDNDPTGKILLDNCFGRLHELQLNGRLSNRIECLVQDLVDARNVNWHKKVHKEKAKGLAQIQQEVEDADLIGGSTVRAQYGTIVQLGERSNLLHNKDYAAYVQGQEKLHQKRLQQMNS